VTLGPLRRCARWLARCALLKTTSPTSIRTSAYRPQEGAQPPVDPVNEKDTCVGFQLDLTLNPTLCASNSDCVTPETCDAGGTCSIPCTSDSDCSASGKTCGPNGVCWVEEQYTHALYRCERDSDCPPGANLKCRKNVWIKCNTCVTATWKLKGGPDGTSKRLFDVSSNPEEEERLNFVTCEDSSGQTLSPGVNNVKGVLEGDPGLGGDPSPSSGVSLKGWLSCMSSQCTTPY